jgi:hypothetical protein
MIVEAGDATNFSSGLTASGCPKAEWVEAVPGGCVERLCKRCKEDGLYLVVEGRMGSTALQRQGGGILP